MNTDLLEAVARKRTDLKFEDIDISLISLFELQAKAAKLEVPAEFVIKAIETILTSFRVIPFYKSEIIKVCCQLRRIIPDYIDCVVAGTAIVLKLPNTSSSR